MSETNANVEPICGRREYIGDGVYHVCRRPKGHDDPNRKGGHDYGWGIDRGPSGRRFS